MRDQDRQAQVAQNPVGRATEDEFAYPSHPPAPTDLTPLQIMRTGSRRL
jgi:hypothetical protein